MKLLVDMNLSPSWVTALEAGKFEATHWSKVGQPDAPDSQFFDWARQHGSIIFTHDLDFGAMLALTGPGLPSAFQIRTQDVAPAVLAPRVIALLRRFEIELGAGALIVADELRERVRLLPLSQR